jgi:hypothetical protein
MTPAIVRPEIGCVACANEQLTATAASSAARAAD